MIRDTRLESREARLKLKERKDREPYWRLIHKGLYLGYRKGAGNGVWYVRFRNNKRYIRKNDWASR